MKWLLGAVLPIASFICLISGIMFLTDRHGLEPAWSVWITATLLALILFAAVNATLYLTNLPTTVEGAEEHLRRLTRPGRRLVGPRRIQ